MLGVQLTGVTPELRRHLGGDEDTGVLVAKVLEGTPAEEAGILVGDMIVAVDGEPVEDAGDIRHALHGKSGETVEVEVIREGARQRVDIVLPEREERLRGPRTYYASPDDGRYEVRSALREARRRQRQARRALARSPATLF